MHLKTVQHSVSKIDSVNKRNEIQKSNIKTFSKNSSECRSDSSKFDFVFFFQTLITNVRNKT